MKQRSTATNLLEFTMFAEKAMNCGTQIDVLYTNFSKAFDRVSHKKLIDKLRGYDILNAYMKMLPTLADNGFGGPWRENL